MSFRSVFIAVVIAFALILGAFLINRARPKVETDQPFYPLEWVAVWASAIAVGFLATPLLVRVSRRFLSLCGAILLAEAGVGFWGFLLHVERNLHGPSAQPFKNFIYGAAPLAPLLFPNLMVLGMIALWRLRGFAAQTN